MSELDDLRAKLDLALYQGQHWARIAESATTALRDMMARHLALLRAAGYGDPGCSCVDCYEARKAIAAGVMRRGE